MEEITLQVQRDEQTGWLIAWWDDPDGTGGITTQGQDLRDLQQQITEAVAVHFDEGAAPRRIRVHFVSGKTRTWNAAGRLDALRSNLQAGVEPLVQRLVSRGRIFLKMC